MHKNAYGCVWQKNLKMILEMFSREAHECYFIKHLKQPQTRSLIQSAFLKGDFFEAFLTKFL